MNQKLALKTKLINGKTFTDTMHSVLRELQMLRNELSLLLPNENVSEYAHADRIRRSYRKALKKYPLAWK